jgi:tetratricopeptide (TPR) repeat protein
MLLAALVLGCLVLIQSCSTKKNTVVSRWYHNTTSRFNGYFYADLIIDETAQRWEKENKDDYSKILPIFIYPDNKAAKTYYPDMDKSIKKSSLVIQRHTITDKKGREIPGAVKWIDDNYLVLGKAHFYKREFFDALESFEYVAKTYKKDENRFMAMMWMIRTYNELGTLSQSSPIIDLLNNDKQFPKKYEGEFSAISADYYAKRGDYENAITSLEKATQLTRKKQVRARYTFILAQLYEQQGNNKKASQLYGQVIKQKPPYEMVFNARMKRATLYDVNAGSAKEIKKELLRMLKDDKNNEYLDQVYYALAIIEQKENDVPQAIDYLKRSVRNSTNNTKQKGISYVTLADIYFERPDYKNAQAYYDSSVVTLPKDYPGYDQIAAKKKSLTSLVSHLNTIALEDSLQKLAKLTEAERDQVIAALILRAEEEEKKKQEEKENPLNTFNNPNNNNNTTGTGTGPGGTMWVLYNPTIISFGIQEFTKKWGDRTLEDNWRRSNKQSVSMQAMDIDENPAVDSTGVPIGNDKGKTNKKTKEYYLQGIPLTADAMEKSNARIIDAYYNLGSIYKEQLMNNDKSAEAFEELLRRYSENKHKLSAYYQLYRLYTTMGNQSKADFYKNLLLTKHPESEYTKLLLDPDYNKKTQASKNEVEQLYTETFTAYSEGRYSDVILSSKKADTLYPKNFLAPKFDFLKALSIGKTQGMEAYISALTQITIKHPKDEVKVKAEEILAILKNQNKPQPKDSVAVEVEIYKLQPAAEHFVVLVASNKKVNIGQLKTRISDFNSEFYSTAVLNIGQVGIDNEIQIVSVKSFMNADKAIEYYATLKSNGEVFKNVAAENFSLFAISVENYAAFYKDKNIEKYMKFFRAQYPAD